MTANASSHTGKALRDYETAFVPPSTVTAEEPRADALIPHPSSFIPHPSIQIHRAREHNLKNIDVTIPRNRFTVLTGVSGSGKSTLAFDIVFAEGQRRYLESLNAYARQFVEPSARPDVDAIFGIPPTVAIEQRTSRGGRKSTVATLTEIHHFLRLLSMKLGAQCMPAVQVAIERRAWQRSRRHRARLSRLARGVARAVVVNRKGYYTDLAKWARGKGHTHLRVDREFIPTGKWPRLSRFREHTIELPVADVHAAPENEAALREALHRALDYGKGVVHVLAPLETLEHSIAKRDPSIVGMTETVFSVKRACPSCGTSFPELDPRLFSYNSRHGWCATCYGTGLRLSGFDEEQTGEEIWWNDWYEGESIPCEACGGNRLNPTALAVRFRGHSIGDLSRMSVSEIEKFFSEIRFEGREADIARDIVSELSSRLAFLNEVGLSYLALDRAAPTLSGGEAQRIRLAAQLGSNLRGVAYILDEPTIGLHPRDNRVLLAPRCLRAKEPLLVVEHDEDTIRRAEHVIDLGPGAGSRGGHVVGEGSAAELMLVPGSITGRFLAAPLRHPLHVRRGTGHGAPALAIEGASLHNLKNLHCRVPLGRLVVRHRRSGLRQVHARARRVYANLAPLAARATRRASERMRRNAERRRLDPQVAQEADRSKTASPSPYPSSFGFAGCRGIPAAKPSAACSKWIKPLSARRPAHACNLCRLLGPVRRLYAEVPKRACALHGEPVLVNTAGGRCDACEGQG